MPALPVPEIGSASVPGARKERQLLLQVVEEREERDRGAPRAGARCANLGETLLGRVRAVAGRVFGWVMAASILSGPNERG
jgi:hypothetical protein